MSFSSLNQGKMSKKAYQFLLDLKNELERNQTADYLHCALDFIQNQIKNNSSGSLGDFTPKIFTDSRTSISGDLPHPTMENCEPVPYNKSRRGAVSASVITEEDLENHEKIVILKDYETTQQLHRAFRSNLLLAHLEDDERSEVFDAMKPLNFKKGETIIKEGDDGDNFYVVDSGIVDVFVSKAGENPVGSVTAGGSFGELALIYNTKRAATVIARDDVKLWAIDLYTYRRILMGTVIRKRKIYLRFLDKISIFSTLEKWEKMTIADALEPVVFDSGTVITTEGHPGDEFFIILEGQARVLKNHADSAGAKEIGKLAAGSYFGEVALLTNQPRQATIVSETVLRTVKLDRDRFERVMGPCVDILKRNLSLYHSIISEQNLIAAN